MKKIEFNFKNLELVKGCPTEGNNDPIDNDDYDDYDDNCDYFQDTDEENGYVDVNPIEPIEPNGPDINGEGDSTDPNGY